MPFYFRKSVSAGPFRFNLSGSGIGMSVGVKGFRVGTGPRGHYVRAGRGGLYYRATFGESQNGRSKPRAQVPQPHAPTRPPVPNRDVDMIPVSSGSVLDMSDERHADLLSELNEKQSKVSSAMWLGIAAAALTLIAMVNLGAAGAIGGIVILTVALFVGARLDAHRRSAVVMYELEQDASAAYEAMTAAFDHLAASSMKWHVDSGGAVRDIHS